jgi:hypothetical protein
MRSFYWAITYQPSGAKSCAALLLIFVLRTPLECSDLFQDSLMRSQQAAFLLLLLSIVTREASTLVTKHPSLDSDHDGHRSAIPAGLTARSERDSYTQPSSQECLRRLRKLRNPT